MFKTHEVCLNEVLKEISSRYRQKKVFFDIGCGDGKRTALFANWGRKVWGIDRINWLDKKAANKVSFKKGDFIQKPLPFKKESFDFVFSFDVIEHLREPRKMLQEVKRVIKKDGVFIISTPNRNRLLSFPLQLLGLRRFPYFPNGATAATDPYAAHVIEYTARELENLLAKEGFEVKTRHKIFYGFSGRLGLKSFFSLPLFHNIIFECQKR